MDCARRPESFRLLGSARFSGTEKGADVPVDVRSEKLSQLVDENVEIEQIGTGFTFTEGPIWHPRDEYLLFSDMPADVRRKWTPDGRVEEVMRPSNKCNGMTYDADLNLLVCEHA